MTTSIVDEVKKAVNEDIENLTQAPRANDPIVKDIIARHATLGAEGDPALEARARDLALDYYKRGVPPDESAAYATAQVHQDAVNNRPSLDEQRSQLEKLKDSGNTGAPTPANVQKFADSKKRELSSASKGVLSDAGSSFTAAKIPPGLAATAQLAIVNASSGGTMLPAGLEINGDLNATVYDNVTLDFQDSQIKTTVGATTYTHTGNVNINAEQVYINAQSIKINASEKETNIVDGAKIARRSQLTLGLGPYSILNTPGCNYSMTGCAIDFSVLNASAAPIRVGFAFFMHHHGKKRQGIKGFKFENVDSLKERSGNLALNGIAVLLLFI